MSVLIPYASLYFSERGFSLTAVGFILSLWAFVSVVAQPVMGMINDRLGHPKRIMLVCVLLASVLGLGFNLMGGLTGIIILSLFFAWFETSAGPIGDALAVEVASRDGFSFGNVRLFGALSYAIGTFATGILYERIGYDHIFIYYFGLSLAVCVTILFLPATKVSRTRVTLFGQIGEVVRNKPFMVFVVTSTLMMMSASTNLSFLPLYFKEMGFNKSWIGSAFAIAAIIEVPMFWIATRLSKRIGRYPLLCLAAAIYGSQYLVMFLFSDVTLTLAVQLLNGVAFAFAAGTAVEVVQGYATEGTKATLQTVYAAVTWGLGGIIGNAVGGVITDHLGAKFLYLILFCLCMTSSLLYILTRHHQPSLSQEISG